MKAAAIQSMDDLHRILKDSSSALCLYSGGLDGSWLLAQLAGGSKQITALHLELGGEALSPAAHAVCDQLGIRLQIIDCRQRFASEFVSPAIMAQARYLGGHPLSASLSRPLMATIATEVAAEQRCNIIIHTADRSQNSLRRFNGALGSLDFKGRYGSPFALSQVTRQEKRQYLDSHGISGFVDRINSSDSNLWGREYEAGDLDNPEEIYLRSELFADPDPPAPFTLQLGFKAGVPTTLDEEILGLPALLDRLTFRLAGTRIGRFVWLEELQSGKKVQEVHDMPAATLILDAYRRLESAVIPAESIREKMHIEQLWVREAAEGRWYGPLRSAAQSFITDIASHVHGSISYRIAVGEMQVTSLRVTTPLYVTNRDQVKAEADDPDPDP